MKDFSIRLVLFLCVLCLPYSSMAAGFDSNPAPDLHTLPYTVGGHTFTDVFSFVSFDGYRYDFYFMGQEYKITDAGSGINYNNFSYLASGKGNDPAYLYYISYRPYGAIMSGPTNWSTQNPAGAGGNSFGTTGAGGPGALTDVYIHTTQPLYNTDGSVRFNANWNGATASLITACSSWTYTDWGVCQSQGIQTRSVLTSAPDNCVGGSPVITQSCTYDADIFPAPQFPHPLPLMGCTKAIMFPSTDSNADNGYVTYYYNGAASVNANLGGMYFDTSPHYRCVGTFYCDEMNQYSESLTGFGMSLNGYVSSDDILYQYTSTIALENNMSNWNPLPFPVLTAKVDPPEGGNMQTDGIVCGEGLPLCTNTYLVGKDLYIGAYANPGYVFAYWIDNGTILNADSHSNSLHTIMNASKTITAKFVKPMSVNVTVDTSIAWVKSTPDGGGQEIHCDGATYSKCDSQYYYGDHVSLDAHSDWGHPFVGWKENGQIISTNPTYAFDIQEARSLEAVFLQDAKDFVFPVRAEGVTDPLQNKNNPIGNGWDGYGVGEHSAEDGHLGQDYYLVGNVESAGMPVYAVADGIIVEVKKGPGLYGWSDNSDHGWGPVVVILHYKQSVFNTADSIVTASCDTEINPRTVYSLYGHLSKTSIQGLSIGQIVHKGDKLGEIGAYGVDQIKWSKNHLHFELKDTPGYNEKAWYSHQSNWGQCPGTAAQADDPSGVGVGYSYEYNFAPHRYKPKEFISNNQE